jgi:hypothetical protein
MSGCIHEDVLEVLALGGGAELEDADALEPLEALEAHLAGCPRCAGEVRRLREERRLFRAREAEARAQLPSFEGVLARMDAADRPALLSSRRRVWFAMGAVAAALLGVVGWMSASDAPAPRVAKLDISAEEDETPELSCYEGEPSSVEEAAYTTDRAVASAEEVYRACLMATPRELSCAALGGARRAASCEESDVTCSSGRP